MCIRDSFTGAQTRGYGTEFAKLAYKIDTERPLAALKAAMSKLSASYAFPNDADFKHTLLSSDVYGKRICFHVLEALENRDSKELTDTSKYSVEHVMPQNKKLSSDWKKMLGEDWGAIQTEWLHRLGNLTLTGYNSTYSDKSFEEKKKIKHGFSESSVRLNKDIREAKEWGPKMMSERGERLAEQALAIWPPLKADPTVVREMEAAEKRALSKRRNINDISMSEATKELFLLLQKEISNAFPSCIEMAEKNSVSYHDHDFFLEVIPRKNYLTLLIALDYKEAADEEGYVIDTADYKFIPNSNYDAGVMLQLYDDEDIEWVMDYVAKAHTLLL